MSDDSGQRDGAASKIRGYLEVAERLWREYLANGPGGVDASRYALLKDQLCQLGDYKSPESDLHEFTAAIDDVAKLALKFTSTPEGLCFVTGEAGLVPRQDQHQRYEECLTLLRSAD